MNNVQLNKEIIDAITSSLNRGYDIEIRRNKYGVTVAEVSKRLVYKNNPTTESEVEK